MKPDDGTRNAPDRVLAALLDRAGRRWRLRVALAGLAAALLAWLLVSAAAAWTIAGERYAPAVVDAARVLVWTVSAFVAAAWLVAALRQRLDRRAVARRLEAHAPVLDGLLLTAVAGAGPRAGGLWRAVADSAVGQLRRHDVVDGADRVPLRRAAGALVAVCLLGVGAVSLAPPALRHAASLLLPASDPLAPPPYGVEVLPGAATVVAGADFRVSARASGFAPARAALQWRRRGETGWSSLSMLAGGAGGEFEAFLFDLGETLEYRVDADGVVSPTYPVEVLPRPAVRRIDLAYEFPAGTGRAPERTTDGGPISAVAGTRVTLDVLPVAPVTAGRLVLDDDLAVPLAIGADGSLRASLSVERDGHYRVELDAGDGRWLAASPEYPIAALVDRLPVVEIRRPGRDAQVTRIEELEFEVRASDDLAVHDLELVLSVNGEPDEVLPLGEDGAASVTATALLALEERALEPGDLVAFHARARDGGMDGERTASSDLYFLEVRPFDRAYRRADGGGGGGGAGGGQQQEAGLAEQQRELVVAMFNALREADLADDAAAERADLFAQAQARVRDRVEAIVRRLGTRPVVEMNPGYRAMAEELPRASAAMVRVEALLAGRDLAGAMDPARQALRHLQRADAAFRDVQVAQQMAGGQGGAGASEAGDLANLFALEMDRFRSQYSDVQRGRWDQPQGAERDRLAERMRELAERQQREVERLDRRAQRGEGGGAASQQQLAAELERVARELERLRLEQPDNRTLADSLDRVRDAQAAMREAAAEGDGEAGRRARDSLREAGRALDGDGRGRLAEAVESAGERAGRLAGDQRRLREALEGAVDATRAAEAVERKDALADAVAALRDEVQGLADRARDESNAAARDLRGAADTLGGERLAAQMERSRQRLAAGEPAVDARAESAIEQALEEARGRLASAAETLSGEGGRGPGEGDGDDAAQRLAGLVEALEAAQRRLAEAAQGGEPGDGAAPGQAGTPRDGTAGQGAGADGGAVGNDPGAGGQQGQAGRPSTSATVGGGAGGGSTAPQGGAAGGSLDGRWGGGTAIASGAGVIGWEGPLPPFRDSVARSLAELDRVRRDLPADSSAARDIDHVVDGLADLVDDRLATPEHALERHAELLARLQRVREALGATGAEGPPPLLARDPEQAPSAWQDRVADYFRGLAAGDP